MSGHQIHFERKFYKDKKTGYWISTDYPRIRVHQWVWICIHEIIPKKYHIHHKNENKSDNRIENLELMEGSRHRSLHMSTPERKERSRQIANKVRALTKKWHASEEGRKWHKIHALKNNFGNWDPLNIFVNLVTQNIKAQRNQERGFVVMPVRANGEEIIR
jgi:hypothetical protein